MNPQYLQQQNSYYGAQPHLPYGEPNANFPPKGGHDSQSFPPQKSGIGISPGNNSTLTHENNLQHGPPPSNQNNLVDQMSNISLSGQQRSSLSTQNVSPKTENNMPPMPYSSNVNGVNNQNHYSQEADKNLSTEKSSHAPLQQGPPTSQPSSLPFSQGSSGKPQFSGPQQYSGQTSNSGFISGSNIPKSTPQPPTSNNQNQMQNQQTSGVNRQNVLNQSGLAGPPLPGQQQPQNFNKPLVGGPSYSGQNLSGPLIPGQNVQGLSASMNQQNISRPPLSGQPNLSGPQFSHPPGPAHLTGSMPGQQNFSGPPIPGQNLSGPPMPGQNFSGPLLNQQNMQSQASYPNQLPGQQFSQTPPYPGQPGGPQCSANQGFPQQNYPGQSPMYGNQASPYQGGMPSGPSGYAAAQAQQGRLNPDQMPSPVQVFQEDQRLKGGDFITNQKGLMPPLVTTKFVVHDQGNASPRFIRSSIYTVPTTADIIKQAQIPFALILSPMAQVEEGEYEPPIVNMGEIGPVRCNRCKAYMCPFMQFVDAGRRFQCMFCKATTEVPQEYFQHLDHTGQRMDRYDRPELMLGTFEYLATKDYCRNNTFPKPPALIFVIDVTYNNVKSGLVNLLCGQMKQIIRNLPIDAGQTKSNMKIGFITYNNSIHFYNCKANLAQPQMLFVGDVQDVFMPLLEGFLCDPEESEAIIDSLMVQIPAMFGDTRETETILGPAIQAGLEALKAAECAGKILVFHSSLPTGEAPGKLKSRDERNLLGTDKEKSVLAPQTNFYNNLGQECVGAGCSVDLFLFNNSYIDVATIGQVSRLTGGEVYKYTYFQADIDGERLITDIINNISRPIAFDAVMRVRTSTGVRPTDFYGHLYMSNTTDVELASIDCDKAIAVEVKHDDKLADDEGVYAQAALLYTSCSGIRRLRIINLSLNTSSKMAELYKTCDLDAMINFIFKQSVSKLVEFSPKAIKDGLNSRCATILATYRKHCAQTSQSSGQLILPECMKLLPLYINSLLKSDALTGGAGITIDQKSYVMMSVSSMPIIETVAHVYPRLIALHNIDPHTTELPPMMRCSIDRFEDHGVYLLENGIHMFIWLGLNINPQWVQAVFGAPAVVQIDTDKSTIPVLDNSLNKRVRDIIGQVQSERRYCMKLTLTRQREKMEMVMKQFLIEDRGTDGSAGYVDYLCHMHREIRSLLS